MEYRINQRTGDRISVLGFGTSYIAQASERDAVATIQRAYGAVLIIMTLLRQKAGLFLILEHVGRSKKKCILSDSLWGRLCFGNLWLEYRWRNHPAATAKHAVLFM